MDTSPLPESALSTAQNTFEILMQRSVHHFAHPLPDPLHSAAEWNAGWLTSCPRGNTHSDPAWCPQTSP